MVTVWGQMSVSMSSFVCVCGAIDHLTAAHYCHSFGPVGFVHFYLRHAGSLGCTQRDTRTGWSDTQVNMGQALKTDMHAAGCKIYLLRIWISILMFCVINFQQNVNINLRHSDNKPTRQLQLCFHALIFFYLLFMKERMLVMNKQGLLAALHHSKNIIRHYKLGGSIRFIYIHK